MTSPDRQIRQLRGKLLLLQRRLTTAERELFEIQQRLKFLLTEQSKRAA